jgi:uncharacterized membrane protein
MELVLCLVLGLIWGVFWALFLQCTEAGRFLAIRRTWLAVTIGVGVDLLILLALLPLDKWLQVGAVIGASSVGIILRSLRNEWQEHMELLRGLRGNEDPSAQ